MDLGEFEHTGNSKCNECLIEKNTNLPYVIAWMDSIHAQTGKIETQTDLNLKMARTSRRCKIFHVWNEEGT